MRRGPVPVAALAWFGCLHYAAWTRMRPASALDRAAGALTVDAFRLYWWDDGALGVPVNGRPTRACP